MRKSVTIMISLVSLIFIFIMVFAGLGPKLIDPSYIKTQISSFIRARTGSALVIYGDLDYFIFPEVTFTIGKASLANMSGFPQEEPLASFDSAAVSVRLWPLLSGHIKVVKVTLVGLRVSLERSPAGMDNWKSLSHEFPDIFNVLHENPVPSSTLAGNLMSGNILPFKLGLAGLEILSAHRVHIVGGTIRWRDHRRHTDVSLTNLNVAEKVVADGSIDTDIHGDWHTINPATKGRLSLGYRFGTAGGNITIDNMRLLAQGEAFSASIKEIEIRLATDMVLNSRKRLVTFKSTEMGLQTWIVQKALREMRMTLRGNIDLDMTMGTVHMPDADLFFRTKADFLPPTGLELAIKSDLSLNLTADSLTLNQLRLKGPAKTALSGYVLFRDLHSDLSAEGTLDTAPFDPKALLVALGRTVPVLTDSQTLALGSLKSAFKIDSSGVEATDLALLLDNTHITGSARVKNFSQPTIQFDLKADQLELARYWPTDTHLNNPEHRQAREQKILWALLMPELSLSDWLHHGLEKLNLSGSLHVDSLVVAAAPFTNLDLSLAAKEGIVVASPYQFKLFGGLWSQVIRVDLQTTPPQMVIEKDLKGVQVQPFLQHLANIQWLTGTVDLSGQLETSGGDALAVRKNLNGSYWLGMHQGVFHGLDVAGRIQEIQSEIGGESYDKYEKSGEKTPFSELTATATVQNGILTNQDLLAVSSGAVVKGQGRMDLGRMSLEYEFKADAQAALKSMQIPYWDQLKGLTLPIRIKGSIDSLEKPVMGTYGFSQSLRAAKSFYGAERDNRIDRGANRIPVPADRISGTPDNQRTHMYWNQGHHH